MTITPRKRHITAVLKQHLRHGPKTALVDAVDTLLEEAERCEREACALVIDALSDDPLMWHRQCRVSELIRARSQGQAEAAE